MRDKKHFWLDVLVAGVVVAQILLCIAPRKAPVAFHQTDLSKLTPGNSIDIDVHGQSVKIEIPKGESADSGTFSLIPSKGSPIRGIHRDGKLDAVTPRQSSSGGTELVITVRSLDATPQVTTLAFESSGLNFVPRKTMPMPRAAVPQPTGANEENKTYWRRKVLPTPTKVDPTFVGTKEVRSTN